ncbi:MAG: cyclic nucleotide-binding domain-containing protein [Myxococcota bacterium]
MNAEHPFDPRLLEAPLLRELSASAKGRISEAGRTLQVPAGSSIFGLGQSSDHVYVLARGSVQLMATPRGHDHPRVIRDVGPYESFGEEALLGHARRAEARAATAATFVSIPGPLFRRAAAVAGEQGDSDELQRLARRLRRNATKDILRAGLFFRDLPDEDFAMAVDGAKHIEVRRSDPVYRSGDAAKWLYLVLEGMVQVQSGDGGALRVTAYLTPGDFFGDDDIVAARRRKRSAVAVGHCQLLAIPARLFRTLADRNGRLLRQLQRTSIERRQAQREVVREVAPGEDNSTRHVFADLYQMQMASSLLTIDQDLCVRCGHCTWTCNQVHGVARIVRRGDKTLARLDVEGRDDGVRSLMLPNSCQHCSNPVCMIDCPTAAIGRDPEGEVFIREELCTGCSNCAKACPWDNIQMAPRPKSLPIAPSLMPAAAPGAPAPVGPTELAVKCDLCRDYSAPACVSACPTEAILRLDPSTDFRDVASLMGNEGRPRRSVVERVNAWWPLALGVAGLVAGSRIAGTGLFASAGLVGLTAGVLGAVTIVLAMLYVAPKRIPRSWLRRKKANADKSSEVARSKVRRFLAFHIAVGLLAMGAVALHTQMRVPNNIAGAAALSFWVVSLLGILSAWVYRSLPRRLTKLERKSLLPEDFPAERERLDDRFRRAVGTQPPAVQAIVGPALSSYVRTPLGTTTLIASGRTLKQEEALLLRRVTKRIPPVASGETVDIKEAVRSAVAVRALPARIWLMRALRMWLPAHMLATAVLMGLLIIHVVTAMERWL